jgi:hypothetical protein
MPNLLGSNPAEADDHISRDNRRTVTVDTAVKLLKTAFDGKPGELNEFVENVEDAFSLLHPENHPTFFKILLAHIKADAKTVFSYRTIPEELQTWETVKNWN